MAKLLSKITGLLILVNISEEITPKLTVKVRASHIFVETNLVVLLVLLVRLFSEVNIHSYSAFDR